MCDNRQKQYRGEADGTFNAARECHGKSAYFVRAITAMQNSSVNIGGNAVFELAGADTIGLDVSDNSKVAVDGNYAVSAKATTGEAKGMGINKSDVQVGGDYVLQAESASTVKGMYVNNSQVQIEGAVSITGNSSGAYGNGIDTQQSTVKMGSAYIKVNSDSAASDVNSLGIYSYWDTNVTVDGDTVVEVTADKNNVDDLHRVPNGTGRGGIDEIHLTQCFHGHASADGNGNGVDAGRNILFSPCLRTQHLTGIGLIHQLDGDAVGVRADARTVGAGGHCTLDPQTGLAGLGLGDDEG